MTLVCYSLTALSRTYFIHILRLHIVAMWHLNTITGGGGGDTHLGYGILGGKKSGIWDMRAKKFGIWDMGKSSGIWDIGVEIINF